MQIIDAAQSDPNIILFIDEIHMLIGSGTGGNNAMDGANILKPALSGRDLSLIGATTTVEYNRFIERDRALQRRFAEVRVPEPSPEATIQILGKRLPSLYELYGNAIYVSQDTIESAVKLSGQYIPDRHYPDKAFEVLDRACARARIEHHLNGGPSGTTDADQIEVTPTHIELAIRNRAGVDMQTDMREMLQSLEKNLKAEIVGQEEAVVEIVKAMKTNYMLSSTDRPIGVFLFVGPTGVGKTQLAKSLAKLIFRGESGLLVLDMSEFMEEHSVSKLIGSPPGYEGHQEGGRLTEELRKNGQRVVLLDEVEKAHHRIMNIFLQVFSDGRLTDGMGRTVSANETVFIMTSNLGYEHATSDTPMPTPEDVRREVEFHFRPEMLNRLDKIVQFSPLKPEHMLRVVDIHFNSFKKRLQEDHGITVELLDEAREWLAKHGHDLHQGARPLIRLIKTTITQPLSEMYIQREIQQGSTLEVYVNLDRNEPDFTMSSNRTE